MEIKGFGDPNLERINQIHHISAFIKTMLETMMDVLTSIGNKTKVISVLSDFMLIFPDDWEFLPMTTLFYGFYKDHMLILNAGQCLEHPEILDAILDAFYINIEALALSTYDEGTE